MNWGEILMPVVVEHLAPLVLTVAGGAIAIVVARVGAVVKRHLDVEIDAELNALLHGAIGRAVEGLLAGGATSRERVIASTVAVLRQSNPDALRRFGLDRNAALLDELVGRSVDYFRNQKGK